LLWPLLYILYTAELEQVVAQHDDVHQYADVDAYVRHRLCLGYSRPRRIVANLFSCALLEAYLLTYLLTYLLRLFIAPIHIRMTK